MQTVPLHLPKTHSQPTTNYTDITATAGAGIITHFELSKYILKVVIIVAHQVITVCYAEPAIVTITRHNEWLSTYVTLNLTSSASADLVSYTEMTLSKAITMTTTINVAPTLEGTPSSTNSPTSGTYIVKCNYSATIQQILPNQSTLSDDGEKENIVSDLKIS